MTDLMTDIVLITIGLLALFFGGESLVRGASKIASDLGMSRLLVGLTVVSFGTSAPEMAICIDAVRVGESEIALGNIVGSNISNVLLILGLTSLVVPIVVHQQVIRREIPFMIAVSALFFLLAFDRELSKLDGMILILSMGLFLYYQFITMRRSNLLDFEQDFVVAGPTTTESNVFKGRMKRNLINTGFVLIGIVLLWVGATWMVKGASSLAAALGVSQLVIGLTIVAIGSSAPEIVTSLVAALRGHPEMAIGNVLGSNIANLSLVGGASAVISSGIAVPDESLRFDIPIMLAAAFACLPVCASGNRIDRWEGGLFLGCYGMFVGFLFGKPYFTEVLSAETFLELADHSATFVGNFARHCLPQTEEELNANQRFSTFLRRQHANAWCWIQ